MSATTHHRPPTATPGRVIRRELAELVADMAARWPAVLVLDPPDEATVHVDTPAGTMHWPIETADLDLMAHVRRGRPDHPLTQTTGLGMWNRVWALRSDRSAVPRPVVGARTLYRDGRGDVWITSATDPDRIRALTPEHAPPRHDTPAGVLHATGSLTALGSAR
ncbi:hypothetical protein [Embleya sp. NPDC050493]|uniref:hypothetical protein n=1 Tax=Embleya sp. NPDC050493 TaxID=3363989 RepID=UPI0037A82A74